MFKEQNIEVLYDSLVQLTTAHEEGDLNEPMTMVCHKFNRAHTILIPNNQLDTIAHYDNSFFVMEYERYSEDSHTKVCFSDLFRLRHICSGEYLTVEEWVINGNMNVILSREPFAIEKGSQYQTQVGESLTVRSQHDDDMHRDQSEKPGSVFEIRQLRSFEKPMTPVKVSSRFSIYCPKYDVHLCCQSLADKKVVVGMVEPPSSHYGWKLQDIHETSHAPNHIRNFDLVYITNRNTSGKLTMKGESLVVEEPNRLYPLKTQPKSFECIWRITKLMENKYKRVKDIFRDSNNSPATDLQAVLFSNAILDPFLKDYQLERQEQLDLSSVTLTHVLTGQNLGGDDSEVYMRFSSTDSVYEVNLNLHNADYIKLCRKDGSRLQWIAKQPLDFNKPGNLKLRHIGFVEKVDESSTFRIYKLPRETKNIYYKLIEARDKLKEYQTFLQEKEGWSYTSSQLRRVHHRVYSQVKYVLMYLRNRLERPEQQLVYQTIMYDIGLLRLLLHFIKYLYSVTSRPDAIASLKPLETYIGRTFSDLHVIFRLACCGNNYNKERILHEGASELLVLSLSSHGRFMDVELETLKELLESKHHAGQNITRFDNILELVKVFEELEPKTLQKEYLFVRIMRLLTRSGERILPQNQRAIIEKVFMNDDGHHQHIRRIKFSIGDSSYVGTAAQTSPKRVLVSTGQSIDQIERIKMLWQRDQTAFDEEGLLELTEFYHEATKAVQQYQSFSEVDQGLAMFERLIERFTAIPTREELETRRQHLKVLWKVVEEWIELLSDVCEGCHLHGKWIAETIISPQVLISILDHTQISTSGTMHSCFVRLANNILVDTLWNPLNHFSRVWYDRAIGMKYYQIGWTKWHTDAESYREMVYPALEQYIKRFLHKFLERYPEEKKEYNTEQYDGLSAKFLSYSTGPRYMQLTTRIMRLLRNMVCHGNWEIALDDVNQLNQERLISQLVEMLGRVNTWDGSSFKEEILRIINYFLDQDAQFRLHSVIDLIKEQRKETFKEGTLNVEKVYDTKLVCLSDATVVRLDYRLVHLMLTVSQSNVQLYLLCFHTRQKIMEVQRNSLMARRYATIFELTPDSVRTVELLNEARYIFNLVLGPGGLREIQLQNQYMLVMPIWDFGGPCLIKMLIDITEVMKRPNYDPIDYLKIYKALGNCRRTMQPYCETQRPNESVQRLVMEMGIIEPVMKFLMRCDVESSNQLYRKLIEAAYLMVAVYMWNNEECKAKWISCYRTFIGHAEHSVGALIALREYCRNSYWLQCDDEKVMHIVNVIGKYLVTELYVRKRYTRACRLLDFYSCMIYYHNKFLDVNRMKILLRIVDNDYPRICNPEMLTDVHQLINIIRHDIERNSGEVPLKKTASFDPRFLMRMQDDDESELSDGERQTSQETIRYSPKLMYVVVLFRLLADLVKNHPTNMAKCKKLHPPTKIALVIENARDCWALKASARRLLNNLYYANMQPSYFDTILSRDIPNIISDLSEYIHERLHSSKATLRQQYDFQVREVFPMSMFTHNIMKVLDSLEILFRPDENQPEPTKQRNFIPKRSAFLKEIILSLQSEESVSKQLYLKESMKEASEHQQEDRESEQEIVPARPVSIPSQIEEEHSSDKSPSSQSPHSSKIKSGGRMNMQNLPDEVNNSRMESSDQLFNPLQIKRSESQIFVQLQRSSKENSAIDDSANDWLGGNIENAVGPRNHSQPFQRKRKSTVISSASRDSDSNAPSSAATNARGTAEINKRRIFIRDDWKKHYNMLRIRSRKNWEFNVSIFILFVRIYERLKFMRDSLFDVNSDTGAQLNNIMRYLEASLFEVDLEHGRFTFAYDRRSSFLYLNVLQDLLQLDRRNLHPNFQLREWLASHPLLAEARANDHSSVSANYRLRNPSILRRINLERDNWDTVNSKMQEEEHQVYRLLEHILRGEHIGYFFDNNEFYGVMQQHSQLVLSVYEPCNSIERVRAVARHFSMVSIDREQHQDPQAFSKYYSQKIFNDYESCRQFKQAQLYLPRLLEQHMLNVESEEYKEADNYRNSYISRMDLLDRSINKLLESDPCPLQEDLLEFHFRVLTKKLRRDRNKGPESEPSLLSSYRKHMLEFLSGSVSSKLFNTVIKYNLEDNFKLTHELFFFTANFFGSCESTDAPQPLFELVKHSDPKNLFISKIDSLIEFFVGDIVRNFELEHLRNSSSVGIDYVFQPERHAIERPSEGSQGNLEQSINRRYTFECCKNIYASLQLLCENNFVAFKREFCEQTQSDGRLKANNRNLLIRSTIELRKVFAVFSDRINDLPFKIINFLNEIAQIPCYENQLELAESTFFGDVCDFILNRQHLAEIKSSAREATLKEIIIIIEEFLKVVVSLLESNKEDIYTYFCSRFDYRFVKEVPRIYRELLRQIRMDPHVIEEKIRKMKAVFVMVYKLLLNNPDRTGSLLERMQRIFEDDEKEHHAEVSGAVKQAMQASIRRIEKVNRSFGKSFRVLSSAFWRYSADLARRLLQFCVVPWQDRLSVLPPYILQTPDDDSNNQSDEEAPRKPSYRLDMLIPEPQASASPIVEHRVLRPDRYNYMLNTILSIEVSIDDNLHTLYFFRPEEALTIHEDDDPELERLLYKLDRVTQNSKLSSLLDKLPQLQLYMKYKEFRRRTNYSFGEWTGLFYRIANWASLVVNVLLMLTTHIFFHDREHTTSSGQAKYLVAVQFVQLTFGTLYSYSAVRNNFKREEMGKFIREEEENRKSAEHEEKAHRLKAKFERTQTRLDNNFTDLSFKEAREVLMRCTSIFLYFLICVLGMFRSPYYYSAHLFYLFARIKLLDNVYQAIFKNLQELLLLGLVSICVFLMLSVLVVNLYAPYATDTCSTMLECFFVVYNRQAYLDKQEINDPSMRVLAFEVVYSILFGSLLGNVISGLFTDKFAQLRNLHDRVEQDQSNQCYICGKSRHDIEKEPSAYTSKTSDKFEKHKQYRHNKWNYLYYLYQLKQKQSTEYTGIEYFIEAKWRAKSNSWFPVCEANIHNVREIIRDVDEQF